MKYYWNIPEATRFAYARALFDQITNQNREFIAGLDSPTFDRGSRMDATRNSASMYLQDVTEFINIYQQGTFPLHLADEMVASCRELLRRLSEDYPREVMKPLEHAYNSYFSSWYGPAIKQVPQAMFPKVLFKAMNALLMAIDDFNVYVDAHPVAAKVVRSVAAPTSARAYRTRAAITLDRAAELSGFSKRTIQNLEREPKNSKYPGRNIPENAFIAWALGYQTEKVKKHWANMINHPIPISDLPPILQERLAL